METEADIEHLDAPILTTMDLPLAPPRITATPRPDHAPCCAQLKHLNPHVRVEEAMEVLGLSEYQLVCANNIIIRNPGIFTETGAMRMAPCSAFSWALVKSRAVYLSRSSARFIPRADICHPYVDTDLDEDDNSERDVPIEDATDKARKLHEWKAEQALRKLLAAMVELISYAPQAPGHITDRLGRPLLDKTSLHLLGPKPTPKPRPNTINSDLPLHGSARVSFASLADHDVPNEQMIVEDIDMREVTKLVKVSLLGGRKDAFQFSWQHPELGRMTVLDTKEFVEAMKVMHMAMKAGGEDEYEGWSFVFQVEMMPK